MYLCSEVKFILVILEVILSNHSSKGMSERQFQENQLKNKSTLQIPEEYSDRVYTKYYDKILSHLISVQNASPYWKLVTNR